MMCCLLAVSGMRPPDKRDGAGSHNWGTIVDDMESVDCILCKINVDYYARVPVP